jgi:hypothetical protein
VTGGTPFDTVSGTITVALGGTAGGTLGFSDTQYGFAESGTVAPTGVSLTVKQAGAVVATATTDAGGNGTVAYADGSSEKIAGYVVGG